MAVHFPLGWGSSGAQRAAQSPLLSKNEWRSEGFLISQQRVSMAQVRDTNVTDKTDMQDV